MKTHSFTYIINEIPVTLERKFVLNLLFHTFLDTPDGVLSKEYMLEALFQINPQSSYTKRKTAYSALNQAVNRLKNLLNETIPDIMWLESNKEEGTWTLANKPIVVTETYNNQRRHMPWLTQKRG